MGSSDNDLQKQLDGIQEEFDSGQLSLEDAEAKRKAVFDTLSKSLKSMPKIEGYFLVNEIGEGGFSKVYLANDEHGAEVAIKILAQKYVTDPNVLARFHKEAQIGIRFNHARIVKVYRFMMQPKVAIVMEYVNGITLDAIIGEKRGPIPSEIALKLFKKIAETIQIFHAELIYHRDIKPENIMVIGDHEKDLENCEIKIIDFGIAKAEKNSMTKTSMAMGTPAYMAPEQYSNAKEARAPADIYALGMTLYEMLAGRLPWLEGTDSGVMIMDKGLEKIPPPTAFYPHIPPFIVAAVQRAIRKEPIDRYPSIDEFIHAIEHPSTNSDSSSGDNTSERRKTTEVVQKPIPPTKDTMVVPPAMLPNGDTKPKQNNSIPDKVRTKQYTPPAGSLPPQSKKLSSGALAALGVGAVLLLGVLVTNDDSESIEETPQKEVAIETTDPTAEKKKEERTEKKQGTNTERRLSPKSGSPTYAMKLIKSGTFNMGRSNLEYDAGDFYNDGRPKPRRVTFNNDFPSHRVTISHDYYIGTYEVTEKLWYKVTQQNPSDNPTYDHYPVENISWNDAIWFADKFSKLSGLEQCYGGAWNPSNFDFNCTGYRLPTEAEWEYAAKGSSNTPFWTGSTLIVPNRKPEAFDLRLQDGTYMGHYAWVSVNSDKRKHKVGGKKPTANGLYDIHGNVFEWVWDGYSEYTNMPKTDPKGRGYYGIHRGGGFKSWPKFLRTTYRATQERNFKSGRVGLRLVRTKIEE